MGHRIFGQSI